MLIEPYDRIVAGALGFFGALLLGTFIEYVVHRTMHGGKFLGKKHAMHHQDGWGQGWLGEFWDYFIGSLPVLLAGGLISYFLLESLAGAIGFAAGCECYCFLAAYSHQLQHEKPELVFWLVRPVHHLHHKHHMWKHNFGILVDFWDRIFGTYRAEPWKPERRPWRYRWREYLTIRWF